MGEVVGRGEINALNALKKLSAEEIREFREIKEFKEKNFSKFPKFSNFYNLLNRFPFADNRPHTVPANRKKKQVANAMSATCLRDI